MTTSTTSIYIAVFFASLVLALATMAALSPSGALERGIMADHLG